MGQKNVLIVDNDIDFATQISSLFLYDVKFAESCEEALEMLGSMQSWYPDVLVLRQTMPGFSGIYTALEIHKYLGCSSVPEELPVVLMVEKYSKEYFAPDSASCSDSLKRQGILKVLVRTELTPEKLLEVASEILEADFATKSKIVEYVRTGISDIHDREICAGDLVEGYVCLSTSAGGTKNVKFTGIVSWDHENARFIITTKDDSDRVEMCPKIFGFVKVRDKSLVVV